MFKIKVIVHRNFELPTMGYFVPICNSVSIALRPNYYKTTSKLKKYTPWERECSFEVGEILFIYYIDLLFFERKKQTNLNKFNVFNLP